MSEDAKNVYLCLRDAHDTNRRAFKDLGASLVTSSAEFESAFGKSDSGTLWVSDVDPLCRYVATLADHTKAFPTTPWSKSPVLLSLESLDRKRGNILRSLFHRVIEVDAKSFLLKEEIASVLASEHAGDLLIGGELDEKVKVLALIRGDLTRLLVPFSAFKPTATGTKPDFNDFEVIDHGLTVRLGEFEAAVDALLYEFDPEYRRRHRARLRATEKSFGASLRRLRLQKGLAQTDFSGITEKEIGRIERGEVAKPHAATLSRIAQVLRVKPEEIESF